MPGRPQRVHKLPHRASPQWDRPGRRPGDAGGGGSPGPLTPQLLLCPRHSHTERLAASHSTGEGGTQARGGSVTCWRREGLSQTPPVCPEPGVRAPVCQPGPCSSASSFREPRGYRPPSRDPELPPRTPIPWGTGTRGGAQAAPQTWPGSAPPPGKGAAGSVSPQCLPEDSH